MLTGCEPPLDGAVVLLEHVVQIMAPAPMPAILGESPFGFELRGRRADTRRGRRSRLKPTNDSWRLDETYVRVKGKWQDAAAAKFRGVPLDPSPHRDVIGMQAPLGEQLLRVTVGKREAQVPADRKRNNSRHTVRSYRDTWRLFLRFMAGFSISEPAQNRFNLPQFSCAVSGASY